MAGEDEDDFLVDLLADEQVPVAPATTQGKESVNFRVEINCQKGNHYMRTRRGSGSKRRKEFGTEEVEAYHYDGSAEVVATERAGYYAIRYSEWQSNHNCHYRKN